MPAPLWTTGKYDANDVTTSVSEPGWDQQLSSNDREVSHDLPGRDWLEGHDLPFRTPAQGYVYTMAYTWKEARNYVDAVGCERCAYGFVKGSSPAYLGYCLEFGDSEDAAGVTEAETEAYLAAGLRLFFTSLTPEQWRQPIDMIEDLRRDLQRHVNSLPAQ